MNVGELPNGDWRPDSMDPLQAGNLFCRRTTQWGLATAFVMTTSTSSLIHSSENYPMGIGDDTPPAQYLLSRHATVGELPNGDWRPIPPIVFAPLVIKSENYPMGIGDAADINKNHFGIFEVGRLPNGDWRQGARLPLILRVPRRKTTQWGLATRCSSK